MPTTHTVQQGEHISRIARQYGFFDYLLIWNDGANSALKKQRPNPHVLFPGDVLQIPDPEPKSERRPTGATHTFKVRREPLKLRLVVRDFDNVPVAGAPCELEVEGRVYALTTNGDGLIEQDVDPLAEHGMLRVPQLDMEVPILIGHLDPVAEDAGWIARLINLGYVDDRPGGIDPYDLRSDIEEFQCDFGVKVTGVFDGPTRAKLQQIHGD